MSATVVFCSDQSKWVWSSATVIKSKPCVVIEGICAHCAVEQLKKENEKLQMQVDALFYWKQQASDYEQELRDIKYNIIMNMDAEIIQLKSKLKLAVEALNDLFNKAKDGSHYESIAREALKEIES